MSVTSRTLTIGSPYGNAFVEINDAETGRQVALVRTKRPMPIEGNPNRIDYVPLESGEDYLPLFAAAPEMLMALEFTTCHVCEIYIGDPEPEGEEPCYMCATARQALAKARGGADE